MERYEYKTVKINGINSRLNEKYAKLLIKSMKEDPQRVRPRPKGPGKTQVERIWNSDAPIWVSRSGAYYKGYPKETLVLIPYG